MRVFSFCSLSSGIIKCSLLVAGVFILEKLLTRKLKLGYLQAYMYFGGSWVELLARHVAEHVRSSGKRLLLLLLSSRSILVVWNVRSSGPVYAVVCFIGVLLCDAETLTTGYFSQQKASFRPFSLALLPACRSSSILTAGDNPLRLVAYTKTRRERRWR